ncbi:MAG: energy transducer TonB [Gammaproteobacteria bacterium]|jgi:protein TonB|nr:energy transducer TonB [Gammaproteobacteria bacterium]
MYDLLLGHDEQTRFRNALVVALVAHAVIISSVSFGTIKGEYKTPQIEVTLATQPNDQPQPDATKIAAANQVGSGNLDDITEITSRDNLPLAAPLEQQTPRLQSEDHSANYQDAVTTAALSQRLVNTDIAERDKQPIDLDGISPEVDRLNRELASLQAELDQQTRNFSSQPRVRRLTAASAKQSADAAYLLDWRQRLEAVGNKYYPEASVRYGIYGDLRLLVVIRSDGSLEDVRVLSSSGYAVLDEAAIKIVRMAAPYSPFPAELKATTDKLEIVRTWQFQQNQLSSN